MKKRILQLLVIIIYLCLLTCCNPKEKELRLRIVANSNSEADQETKLAVKKVVKNYLVNHNPIDFDLADLEIILNQKFPKDQITVKKTASNYEAKAYQGKIVQAGIYDTILITIGMGKGNNFWTLLYPDFFNISFEDDHEVEYHSFFWDLLKKKKHI